MKLSPKECLVAIETNKNYIDLPDKIDYNANGKTHGTPSVFGRGVVAVRPSDRALQVSSSDAQISARNIEK